MSPFNLIIILFLLGLGATFIAYLGFFILSPVLRLIKSSKSVNMQSKKRQGLGDFIVLIENENFAEALSILPRVPFLEAPSSTENFLFVRDHNQDFVTRCFFLFEKLGRSTTDIANLEMLFNERFELYSHLFKAQVNKRVLEEKHGANRKKLPTWAKEEFASKEKDVNVSLHKNLKAIEILLAKLSSGALNGETTGLTIH